jgi:hypothetical protein
MNKPFIFRGKETSYSYEWTNEHCFTLNFGDGDKDFIDADGDSYFIHCQYEDDTDSKFFFEIWWEHDLTEVDYTMVTENEREHIKQFMKDLITI